MRLTSVGLSYSSWLRTSPLMRLFLTKRLIVQIRLFCLFPPFSPLFVFSTLPSLSLPVLSIANTVTRSTHQYYWSIADIFHWYILSIQYKIKFLIKHWGWSRFFFLSQVPFPGNRSHILWEPATKILRQPYFWCIKSNMRFAYTHTYMYVYYKL